ncbi:MAG: alpha/beta hydrolase family protein [Hyphomicrobiaceae bacterium]
MVRCNDLKPFARLAGLALAIVATPALAMSTPATPAKPAQVINGFPSQLTAEAASKPLCEAQTDRVFVTYAGGTECIAYYTTSGVPTSRSTILFFQGDSDQASFDFQAQRTTGIQRFMASIQGFADRNSIRIIYVARPGVYGSSGNHGRRRTLYEMQVMNAAVTAIKARLKLDDLILAGQSGGATVSAALLSLGRTDVSCAILGSGGQNVTGNSLRRASERGQRLSAERVQALLFDPTARIASVPRQANRRVFVLGDRTDTVTPFDLQAVYAEKMRAAGHHAETIEIRGLGDMMHGAVQAALPAAVLCARGVSDAQIRQVVGVKGNTPIASAPPRPTPPAARPVPPTPPQVLPPQPAPERRTMAQAPPMPPMPTPPAAQPAPVPPTLPQAVPPPAPPRFPLANLPQIVPQPLPPGIKLPEPLPPRAR